MLHTLCLIGLGNPGKQYHNTRHNVGFLFCEFYCAQQLCQPFVLQKKCHAKIAQNTCHCRKCIVAQPTTFMNHAGRAVQAIVNYYNIDPTSIIVAHDDLDLPLGSYKISRNKNAGGHNGVQNIIDHLGTKDFTRIRIGIDHRTSQQRTNQPGKDYVLSHFHATERALLHNVFEHILHDDHFPL